MSVREREQSDFLDLAVAACFAWHTLCLTVSVLMAPPKLVGVSLGRPAQKHSPRVLRLEVGMPGSLDISKASA